MDDRPKRRGRKMTPEELAAERERRRQILAETNARYAELRADPVVWAEILAERAEWDCNLADGLEGLD